MTGCMDTGHCKIEWGKLYENQKKKKVGEDKKGHKYNNNT